MFKHNSINEAVNPIKMLHFDSDRKDIKLFVRCLNAKRSMKLAVIWVVYYNWNLKSTFKNTVKIHTYMHTYILLYIYPQRNILSNTLLF